MAGIQALIPALLRAGLLLYKNVSNQPQSQEMSIRVRCARFLLTIRYPRDRFVKESVECVLCVLGCSKQPAELAAKADLKCPESRIL